MIDNEDKPNFLKNRQDSGYFADVVDEISGKVPCDTCPWRNVLHEKFIPPVVCLMPPVVDDLDSPVHTQPDDPESSPMDTPDDPKSCHRCIHMGRSYDATLNKEFCSNCQDFSLFEQDAKQIVFQTQVGGGHYKNPNVPDGFPDPAEFCIVHNLGGAETAVIKYMFRHRSKDGLKDLKKAKQYIEFIAACVYNAVI